MKYKKGDRVVIKPWKLMEKQYGLNDIGNIDLHPRFTRRMGRELLDTNRVVQIDNVRNDRYNCIMEGCWELCDEMILGYAFEWGEEIEVRDNEDGDWLVRTFSGYTPGSGFPVGCIGDKWKFVRPIQPDTIEITCRVNGKDVPLNTLSEETLLKIRRNNG